VSNWWSFFEPEERKHTHTVAHNKFSDWSKKEMDDLLVTEIHVGKESIRDRSKKHSGERLAG